MEYVLIDNFNDTINIVCKENGEPLVFESLYEANESLDEQCQNGQVIPLNVNVMRLLWQFYNFMEEGCPFPDSSILEEVLDINNHENN